MSKQEEQKKQVELTKEQEKELLSYPSYWRPSLRKAALRGESIKEMYERNKGLEDFT